MLLLHESPHLFLRALQKLCDKAGLARVLSHDSHFPLVGGHAWLELGLGEEQEHQAVPVMLHWFHGCQARLDKIQASCNDLVSETYINRQKSNTTAQYNFKSKDPYPIKKSQEKY